MWRLDYFDLHPKGAKYARPAVLLLKTRMFHVLPEGMLPEGTTAP